MNILYFAWMREHTGCAAEEIDLPDGVSTVADLVPHLASRSDGHATALRNLKTCLLYTSPSPRDSNLSRMPSSA